MLVTITRVPCASAALALAFCLSLSAQQANVSALSIQNMPMPKSKASAQMLKLNAQAAGQFAVPQAAVATSAASGGSTLNGPSPGPFGPGPGCNLFPAPASVGASVGLSYFGPPPSTTNSSFVGPVQLLKSGVVDDQKGTITLPLYKGYLKKGHIPIWYILTDVSDSNVATLLGLNFSAKLTNAGPGARTANFDVNGDLIFDAGTVDFSPDRVLKAGSPSAFPPAIFAPGSIGDANYGPLVRVLNAQGIFYNAPIVAYNATETDINFPNGGVNYRKVHDQVLAIDPVNETVTLQLINGFSFGRPVWYISMDTSIPLAAAIEGNTYAPLMAKIATGKDDSFSSAVERIFIATNGAMDCANPQRQGLDAAITDSFRPNNTFGGIPTIAPDYSPMWNAQLYEWTPNAIQMGYRSQLREEFQILTYVQDGLITGPGGVAFGDSKFIINCPPVQRLD